MREPVKFCDICGETCFPVYVDALIPGCGGVWATLCDTCGKECGCQYGTGKGQKYKWDCGKGEWVKIEG